MSDTDFVLPSQYLQHIAGQMTRMGVRLPDWLQQLQRPGPNGELEIQHLSFEDFQRLVREAIALTGEPAFGLLVGERLLVQSHGLLGYAAVNSLNLRQALQFTERYLLVRTSLFSVKLRTLCGYESTKSTAIKPPPAVPTTWNLSMMICAPGMTACTASRYGAHMSIATY